MPSLSATPLRFGKPQVANVNKRVPGHLLMHILQNLSNLIRIRYLPEYGVALCTYCKVAVPKNCIANHLRMWHKGCKNRQALINELQELPIAATHAELEPRADGSAPLSFLIAPQPGYRCPECTPFRSINWYAIRLHVAKAHARSISGLKRGGSFMFPSALGRWPRSFL